MAEWTSDETKALIKVWGSPEVQNELDGVVRNKAVYEMVAKELNIIIRIRPTIFGS